MKKIVIIAAAALLSISAFAQSKFAIVNFAELVQLMPEADAARATLAASSQEAQETYQAMVQEFQTKYQTYQQKINDWTPAVRDTKERELTEMNARIQEFEQTIQGELQQQQQQLMAPIQEKAVNTVNELAKAAGYIFVFDATSMLYVDKAQCDDITAAARKKLGIPDDRTIESLQQELAAQAQ